MQSAQASRNVFDALTGEGRIFRNRGVLSSDYVPEDFPHRNDEIDQVAHILRPALEGSRPSNILIYGQTGTGKTAAFLLPIFQRLIQYPTRKVRVLILAPTRELAEQIHQASVELGQYTGVRSVAIYGGVGKGPQLVKLRLGDRSGLPWSPARPPQRRQH